MPDRQNRLEISGPKVALNIVALFLIIAGVARCAAGGWLLGAAAAYGGLLIVFFCGLHGLASCGRAARR